MGRRAHILSVLCTTLFATTAAAQPAAQPLTLVGCLKPWDPSTMGPPPSAVSAPLVLVNAERKAPAAAPQPDRTPLSDAQPTEGAHATYLLKPASSTVNLAAHIARQVEITGMLVADDAAATPAARSKATPPPSALPPPSAKTPPRPGEDAGAPVVFTVTGIKTIERACATK